MLKSIYKMFRVESGSVLVCFLLLVLAYQFLRGINFPNVWSYTHYLFPCVDFFVKRTAIGCLVETLGGKWWSSYEVFTVISFFLVGALFLIWARMICVAGAHAGPQAAPGLIVFCAGIAPVYLANIPGYFDFLGVWIAIFCLALNSFRVSLIATFFGFFVLVFVHEAIVIIFFPLVCSVLLLRIISEAPEMRMRLLLLLCGLSFFLLMTTLLIANSHVEPETARSLVERAQQKSSAVIQPYAFDVFSRSIADNRSFLVWWVADSEFWTGFGRYILNFMLSGFFIALLNFYMLRRLTHSSLLSFLCACAPLSALALTLVAVDFIRWAAWATACSFMLFVWLTLNGGANALRGRFFVHSLAIVIVFYQPFVSIPLLAPREDRPVISSVYEYILDIWEGRQSFLPDKPKY